MLGRKTGASVIAIAALGLTLAACASPTESTGGSTEGTTSGAPASGAPGTGGTSVGFILVGSKDDFGYNQAAFIGSEAVGKAFPDLDIQVAENVPENVNDASRVMERMIDDGAKIIFATSYGHLDAALKVAADHPDVVVVQQGNTITGTIPANAGTFFGTVYEPVYLAGIAAGNVTESNKLGYVYAFPIPQTIANINAFQRGAETVNPDVETITVATSSWCDPAAQREAVESLLSQGVDVISQHQDCTKTIIEATEAAGKYTVGYHADASSLAPNGWVTGSEWNWGPVYTGIVQTSIDGKFTGSEYNANYRVGLKTGDNPFVQSVFGPIVDDATKAEIEKAKTFLASPDGSPFVGPVEDQEGKVVIAAGTVPTYEEIDAMDFFVKGVVGQITN